MCGACSRVVETDEWSPAVARKADRWEAARLVNTALARVGHPARLTCLSGPWAVRTPTGGTRLADSLTEVWRHCGDVQRLPVDVLDVLDTPTGSVASAVRAAAAAVLRPRVCGMAEPSEERRRP